MRPAGRLLTAASVAAFSSLMLTGAASAQADCARAVDVAVAPAAKSVVAALEVAPRGVRPTAAWTLRSEESALGQLVEFRLGAGEGRTADGRRLDWDAAGATTAPSGFRLLCAPGLLQPPPVSRPPAPLEVPRIRGYRYAGAQRLQGSAYRAVGLWQASDGVPESLVVVFDSATATLRAPYTVLLRTSLRLGAVAAEGERGDLFIRIAAVSQGPPGEPVHLLEYAWRDGSAHGITLD